MSPRPLLKLLLPGFRFQGSQVRQRFTKPHIYTKRTFTTASRVMAQEYKLKGISSLNLKPGEKREVEVDGIEEGKVLLCNVGGKITALGSKCTHYGAPLVKGVLTGDGRITCPWHGGESSLVVL